MNIEMVGDMIRIRRNQLGMSQNTLAEAMGCDQRTISAWENCNTEKGNMPKLDNIVSLAAALKCDPEYLLGGAERKTVELSWIAEKIPLSDKAIEYLMWLKGLENDYPEQFRVESGMIDSVLCALASGIEDNVHSIRWDGDTLYYLLAQANEEDERHPEINHSLFIRQAFCMAFGGVAFDYVSSLAEQNMKQLRISLDEIQKDIERDELFVEQRKKMRIALGLADDDDLQKAISEILKNNPKATELLLAVYDGADADELLGILEKERRKENGNI